MYRKSSIVKRDRTIQQKTFGNVREAIKILEIILNPRGLDRLMFDVIRNHSRVPVKFKWSLIDIILTEFKNFPIAKTNEDYLETLKDIASMRMHQGRGNPRNSKDEAYFMSHAYSDLLRIIEKKQYEITHPSLESTPGYVQTELRFDAHSTSR